ncbi:LpxL/LpxP family acyltransferase [Azospirillum sp. sgz302134]
MGKPRGPLAKWFIRRVGYPMEAAFVHGIARLFRALPLDAASDLGGRIGRTVGPLLPSTKTARRNLERAFPEKSRAEIDVILLGMWDNLGRVIAEYPHLRDIVRNGRIEVVGTEHIEHLREDGKAGILVSGHLANWEILGIASRTLGVDLAVVYRAPNNPYVDALLTDLRGAGSDQQIPKGAEGARKLIRLLGKGAHVGLLIDQKMNDGIPVPFFGRDAMTAPAAAQLALRFGIPLVPALGERLGGARFRITVLPPVEPPSTGDRNADVRVLMEHLNHLLEQWIRERPAEWLWLHRRWPN